MALRRRLAERLHPLAKRLPSGAPVISETPLRAEDLLKHEITLSRVGIHIPVIVRGKAFGKAAGRWYHVTFPRPIVDPSVVCVGAARRGEVPRPKIRAITFRAIERLRAVDIPRISINVPRWELHIPTADDFVDLLKDRLGDWGWANWMRDAIAWAVGNWEYAIWNTFFRPRLIENLNDKVLTPIRDSMNSIRDGINATIDRVNERLREVVDRANATLDTLRDDAQRAVNERLPEILPRLYDAWGVPHNMAVTPLHIRNVTETGFDFQSYGDTTCYYIAMGTRR